MYPNPKFNFGFNATISKLVVVLNEKLKLEICFHNFWSFFKIRHKWSTILYKLHEKNISGKVIFLG